MFFTMTMDFFTFVLNFLFGFALHFLILIFISLLSLYPSSAFHTYVQHYLNKSNKMGFVPIVREYDVWSLLNYSRNTLTIILIWILVHSIIIVNSPVVIAPFSLPRAKTMILWNCLSYTLVIVDFTTLGESHFVWTSPVPLQTL